MLIYFCNECLLETTLCMDCVVSQCCERCLSSLHSTQLHSSSITAIKPVQWESRKRKTINVEKLEMIFPSNLFSKAQHYKRTKRFINSTETQWKAISETIATESRLKTESTGNHTPNQKRSKSWKIVFQKFRKYFRRHSTEVMNESLRRQ